MSEKNLPSGLAITWGLGSEGTLGIPLNWEEGALKDGIIGKPQRINDYVLWSQVSCGAFHVVGLSDSRLYSWGRTGCGRLGHSQKQEFVDQPTLISVLESVRIIQVVCGYHHTLALSDMGQIYSWGSGFSGQCGQGTRLDVLEPTLITEIPSNKKFIKIAAGYHHSMAIDEDNKLWTWGTGQKGQLGHGPDLKWQPIPKMIEFGENENFPFKYITAGEFNSLAITISGEIMIWGMNQYGQLCSGKIDENRKFSTTPGFIENPKKIQFKQAAIGLYHVIAISEKDKMYFWGRSLTDTVEVSSFLTRIKCPMEGARFVQVATSPHHILALTDKGTIFAWGAGAYGQQGQPHNDTVTSPTMVPGFKHVIQVSCGYYFSVALSVVTHDPSLLVSYDDDEIEDTSPRGFPEIPVTELKSPKNYFPSKSKRVEVRRRSSPKSKSPRSRSQRLPHRSVSHSKTPSDTNLATKKRPNSHTIAMPLLPISLVTSSTISKSSSSPNYQSSIKKTDAYHSKQYPHLGHTTLTPYTSLHGQGSLSPGGYQSLPAARPYRSLSARGEDYTRGRGEQFSKKDGIMEREALKFRPLSPKLSPKTSPHEIFEVLDEIGSPRNEDKVNKQLKLIQEQFLKIAREEEELMQEEERLHMARQQLVERRRLLVAELTTLYQ